MHFCSWVNNVANYAVLRCENFVLKIWWCKKLNKYHVCHQPESHQYRLRSMWVSVYDKAMQWSDSGPMGEMSVLICRYLATCDNCVLRFPSKATSATFSSSNTFCTRLKISQFRKKFTYTLICAPFSCSRDSCLSLSVSNSLICLACRSCSSCKV